MKFNNISSKIKNRMLVLLIPACLILYIINFNKPVSIVDYGSLECSDSRDFFKENGELLNSLNDKNKITYTFKPVDLVDFEYDKDIYLRMTPMHLELKNISKIFINQDIWNNLNTLEEIIDLLKLEKSPISDNIKTLSDTKIEIEDLKLKSFPGIFIDGQLVPYTIKRDELEEIISSKFLEKNNLISFIKNKI